MNTLSIELSIVSTVFNDGPLVSPLVNALREQAQKTGVTYEIILVNDGSLDNSEGEISKACSTPEIKGISLARNYGQQIAISAGLRFAKGNYVLLIDGDLENPVEAIPVLFSKIKEGFDIVYAISKTRQSWLKRLTSDFFWLVLCRMLNINIVQNQLMLRIMSRRMVEHYNQFDEISRSVAAITYDIGLKVAQVEVQPKRRANGKSNYSFGKRLNMFIDIVFNLSLKPLNFLIFIGFFTAFLSVLATVYYGWVYFNQGSIPGYTSLILSIFLFGSLTVFSLGLIARYLSLIYLEVRGRPLFIVKEKYNL